MQRYEGVNEKLIRKILKKLATAFARSSRVINPKQHKMPSATMQLTANNLSPQQN